MKAHAEAEKRRWRPFRFVATACARAQGHDVDYMSEESDEQPVGDADTLEVWLKSKAVPVGKVGDHNEEPEGTPSVVPENGGGV